jgi:hypothetical protein
LAKGVVAQQILLGGMHGIEQACANAKGEVFPRFAGPHPNVPSRCSLLPPAKTIEFRTRTDCGVESWEHLY